VVTVPFAWRSRLGFDGPLLGAVVRKFATRGVHHEVAGGEVVFHALPRLETEEVARVLEDTARRITRHRTDATPCSWSPRRGMSRAASVSMVVHDPDPSKAALSELAVLAGSANAALGAALARELAQTLGGATIERFPDGEIHV
jgi:hypothetical protein